MKNKKATFTASYDEALEIFDAPVECSECCIWHDGKENDNCPVCGSKSKE